MEELTTQVAGYRFSKSGLDNRLIALAREVPYTLFVNDREILSIATLPTHIKELFVGFLVSEGTLTSTAEIIECAVDQGNRLVMFELDVPAERLEKLEGKGMLTSGCAGGLVFSVETGISSVGRKASSLSLECSTVITRMHELDTFQGIYSLTRGVHAASAADVLSTFVILEDLGRHNAVDKIVGYCFLNDISTGDKLLLTTGRITSEVLTKTARGGFPIVISRSSASATAVAMARQAGVDVVTYVRGGRFNYFPHGAVNLTDTQKNTPELTVNPGGFSVTDQRPDTQ